MRTPECTPPTITPFAGMGWLGWPNLAQETPLTLLALPLVPRKASYPQALMKPYRKGER